MKPRFQGRIVERHGKKAVALNSARYYQHEIDKYEVGDKVGMTLDKKKPTRSLQQNSFLFGVYLPIIADETGHTVDELHAYFAGKFLTETIATVYGEPTRMKKSSTELSKGKFAEYIANIEELTKIPAPDTDEFFYGEGSNKF